MKNSHPRLNSQQVVRKLFSLPEEEDILDDFACALRKKIFIHGRLFCTDNYLCFYANILGFKTKQVIPFKEIQTIKRNKGSISHTIEIACSNLKVYALGGFLRRNEAFQFIYNLWRNSGYCDEASDTGMWSDSEDPAPMEEEKEGITMLPTEDTGDIFETLKVIIPVSSQKFFELLIMDNCPFSIIDYVTERGDTEIESTAWAYNEELLAYTRELKFRTKINGPSIGPKTTRCHRAQLYQKSENGLKLKTSSKALDVPYSSYFVVEEEWDVSEISPEKSMLRCTVKINFLKTTIFSGKIVSRTKSDVTADIETWFRKAKARVFNDIGGDNPVNTEKDLHQLAKYNEVDLKVHKNNILAFKKPSSIQSLLILNTLCMILIFFFMRVISEKIDNIDARIQKS